MTSFERNCPVCNKKFTNLLEYTEHLGKDHRDLTADQILKINKEEKWSFSGK